MASTFVECGPAPTSNDHYESDATGAPLATDATGAPLATALAAALPTSTLFDLSRTHDGLWG